MGSSASIPPVTFTKHFHDLPTLARVKISGSILKRKIHVVCDHTSREWVIVLPRGYSGPIVFHDGPKEDDAVMAVSSRRHTVFEITSSGMELREVTELMHCEEVALSTRIYWFELTVEKNRERFEWWPTTQGKVYDTDSIWNLIKVSRTKLARSQQMTTIKDEKEIVARWIYRDAVRPEGQFELAGTGLAFGPTFHLMALASAVTFHCNNIRDVRRRG